jgi:hypothetical protein
MHDRRPWVCVSEVGLRKVFSSLVFEARILGAESGWCDGAVCLEMSNLDFMPAFAVVLFGVLGDACLALVMLHLNPSACAPQMLWCFGKYVLSLACRFRNYYVAPMAHNLNFVMCSSDMAQDFVTHRHLN